MPFAFAVAYSQWALRDGASHDGATMTPQALPLKQRNSPPARYCSRWSQPRSRHWGSRSGSASRRLDTAPCPPSACSCAFSSCSWLPRVVHNAWQPPAPRGRRASHASRDGANRRGLGADPSLSPSPPIIHSLGRCSRSCFGERRRHQKQVPLLTQRLLPQQPGQGPFFAHSLGQACPFATQQTRSGMSLVNPQFLLQHASHAPSAQMPAQYSLRPRQVVGGGGGSGGSGVSGFFFFFRRRFLAAMSVPSPEAPSAPNDRAIVVKRLRRRRGTLFRARIKVSKQSASMTPPFKSPIGNWRRHRCGPGCSNPRRPGNSQNSRRNIDPSGTRAPHHRSTFDRSRRGHPRGCTNSRRGIDLKCTTIHRSRVRLPRNHDRSRRCNIRGLPRHISCSAHRN